MSWMIQWCDGPTPRGRRPPVTAWADGACRASATGCCAWRGTTAVPSSMRSVRRPRRATVRSASMSFGSCGIHAVGRPAPSAHAMSSSIRVTLRAVEPRSGPIITPMRIGLLQSVGPRSVRDDGFDFRYHRVEWGAGGEDGGDADLSQPGDVGGGDGAADDDGDVVGPGRLEAVNHLAGPVVVGAGEDGEADDGDVLLDGGGDDRVDPLAD